jgi:hypothetical protein
MHLELVLVFAKDGMTTIVYTMNARKQFSNDFCLWGMEELFNT